MFFFYWLEKKKCFDGGSFFLLTFFFSCLHSDRNFRNRRERQACNEAVKCDRELHYVMHAWMTRACAIVSWGVAMHFFIVMTFDGSDVCWVNKCEKCGNKWKLTKKITKLNREIFFIQWAGFDRSSCAVTCFYMNNLFLIGCWFFLYDGKKLMNLGINSNGLIFSALYESMCISLTFPDTYMRIW